MGEMKEIKTGTVSEITVKRKDGSYQTKFMLIDGKDPFPRPSFELAQHWCVRGLLSQDQAELIRSIAPDTPVWFR
jgi:hypothetical protein